MVHLLSTLSASQVRYIAFNIIPGKNQIDVVPLFMNMQFFTDTRFNPILFLLLELFI